MPTKQAPAPKQRTVVYTNDQIVSAATGQWGEVASEIKIPEPLVINIPESDKSLTIYPLTRRRRKALKAAQAAYMMVGAQLAEAQNAGDVDQSVITRIESTLEEAEQAYDKALFGEQYDEVIEFFDDLDEAWWNGMYNSVHEKLVNRVEPPEDACPKCGRPYDEDGEGKDESSSTSSNGTGPS